MPRVSRLKLPPLELGGETIGERVARLRKERGYTQAELAEKVGIIQTIVSAIETNALKLSAEMAIRFALALEISTDDLLLPAKKKRPGHKPSRRVLRRLEQIEGAALGAAVRVAQDYRHVLRECRVPGRKAVKPP